MDARIACVAWMAPLLMAGCAAPTTIDLTPVQVPRESATELATRSQAKLAFGKSYLAAGEEKLGRFVLEQASVDAELASMKAATSRLRAQALRRTARRP